MKTRMTVRHALLAASAAAALISAVANGAPSDTIDFSKLKVEAAAPASSAPDEEMVTRLIVKHRTHRSDKLSASLRSFDGRGMARPARVGMAVLRPMSGDAHVVKLDQPVKLSDARAIAARLMRDGEVESAEPDRIIRPTTVIPPTDPDYASQWHYLAPTVPNKGGANLPNAWNRTLGDASINVAVLDTGYRPHPDLLAAVLQGYDFVTNSTMTNDGDGRDTNPQDPGDLCSTDAIPQSSWHGTHVAGTIAAQMSNGIGGTGIAPVTRILPVRVLGKCGGLTSDIVDGMRWAAGIAVPDAPTNANPAQVLNMSLGASGVCSAAFQSAVNDVVAAGKVIVAAAGNDGSATVIQPANCTGVIAVTAHTQSGDNASYANIGREVFISAPGGGCGMMSSGCVAFSANGPGVYSLTNTGANGPVADSYGYKMGTSMATPHVSGVVALMLSLNTALTSAQIKSYLQSSARPHPAGTTCTLSRYTGLCGEGLLDAELALNKVVDSAPIVSLSNAYQVVAPNALVTLSLSNSVVAPGSGRSITAHNWSALPGNPSVVAINNAGTANATFTAPSSGVYAFKVTVTDSAGKTGTATATVRVNSAPVLGLVADKTVTAGSSVSFTVSVTDDFDSVSPTFQWAGVPAGASVSAGTVNWTSAAPAGTYILTYHATDKDGASSATGTVRITVVAPPSSGGGGGGSLDGESLIGLALLAACMRMRRAGKASRLDMRN